MRKCPGIGPDTIVEGQQVEVEDPRAPPFAPLAPESGLDFMQTVEKRLWPKARLDLYNCVHIVGTCARREGRTDIKTAM